MQNKLYPKTQKHKNSDCPNCGFQLAKNSVFETAIGPGLDRYPDVDFEAEKYTPVRASNFHSEVVVPASQALITAFAVTLPTTIVSVWFDGSVYAPMLIGASTMTLMWFRLMQESNSSLGVTERVSTSRNRQLPRVRAASTGPVIQLDVSDRQGVHSQTSIKIIDLPEQISECDFVQFSRDIISGGSLARANWAGRGKLFSRDAYDGLIAALLHASIIRTSDSGGKALTRKGKRGLSEMVKHSEKQVK